VSTSVSRPRTAARAVAVLAALATFAAGCSGGGGGNREYQPGNKGLTEVRNPSDAKGGELKLVNSSDVDSLDPARAYYGYVHNMMRLYLRTLVTFAPKPGEAGTELVPDLATDLGKSSNGARTWTFTLKDGIKFEDGSPITSRDVKYGIERNYAIDVLGGNHPPYLQDLLQDKKNPYPGPYKDTHPQKLGLSTVLTPDDKTIVFNLNKPAPDFPYILQLPNASPVPRAKDTGAQYQLKPVASGPYRVEKYEKDKQIVFVRNPNWDPKTDTVRKALPDRITHTAGLSANDVDARILAGEADIFAGMSGVQVSTQSSLLKDQNKAEQADNAVTGAVRYFALNDNVPPLDNVECRKAIIYAANLNTLQRARGGVYGGDLATSMYPTTLVGAEKYDPYGLAKAPAGQEAKAKEALTKCGQPNGFAVNIASPDKGKGPPAAEALQDALNRVGIKATIAKASEATYYKTYAGSPKNVHERKLGILMGGWSSDYPAPAGYFPPIVDGRYIVDPGNSNMAEINDPAVMATIDKALAAPTIEQSLGLWREVDRLVMDQARFLPFLVDKALMYANPRVTNLYVNNAWGQYDFVSMGVEK
jgi:peptide/nickel transport system substrate-binding protein